MKKIAVVLSGCGHRDGSEITEAISTLIALSEAEVSYQIFAPDTSLTVTDPLDGSSTTEKRSVLKESARIARGEIRSLKELKSSDFDAVVFPGGFGAALNLCTWAQKGASCDVLPDVEKIIQTFYQEQKPIGAICIAPALIARVLGRNGITVTIGNDTATAAEIQKTGAKHENCAVDDYITDRDHRIITTPAYMYDDAKPFQVFTGIRQAVREVVEMA